MSDLWTTASADAEEATHRKLTATLRIESVQYWPFLAEADSTADFNNRMALVSPDLDSIVRRNTKDAATFLAARAELEASFASDFEVLAAERYQTDSRGVRYVGKGRPAPKSFKDPATCGSCGRTWDDGHVTGVTPAPSARCPFEYMRGHSGSKTSSGKTYEVNGKYAECGLCSHTYTGSDHDDALSHIKSHLDSKHNGGWSTTADYQYVKPAGGGKYKIVQKGTGKTLSTHDSKEEAESAFRAMEMHMHGAKSDCPAGCPVDLSNKGDRNYHMDWHKAEEGRDAWYHNNPQDRKGDAYWDAQKKASKTAAEEYGHDADPSHPDYHKGYRDAQSGSFVNGRHTGWDESYNGNPQYGYGFNAGSDWGEVDRGERRPDQVSERTPRPTTAAGKADCSGSNAWVKGQFNSGNGTAGDKAECPRCHQQVALTQATTVAGEKGAWLATHLKPGKSLSDRASKTAEEIPGANNISAPACTTCGKPIKWDKDDKVVYHDHGSPTASLHSASEDLTDDDLRELAAKGNELAAAMLEIRRNRNRRTSAKRGDTRIAGEGAYITESHNSADRHDVAAGTVATATQSYQTFMGTSISDWSVENWGDGWQLGGDWSESKTGAKDDPWADYPGATFKCRQCGKTLDPVSAMMNDTCGACCRKNQRAVTGAADYTGWHDEGPGKSKDHVWVGNQPSPSDPGRDWIVHYMDGSTINTESFGNEDEALDFAKSKFVTSSKTAEVFGDQYYDPNGKPCSVCGRGMDALSEFPGDRCINCHSNSPEGRAMPTADELTRMWGGPVRRGGSKKVYCPCGKCGKPCEVVGKLASLYECDECRGL